MQPSGPPIGPVRSAHRGVGRVPQARHRRNDAGLAAGPGAPERADAPADAGLRRRSLRGDPLIYPQQRGGEHLYVVAQAAHLGAQVIYLSANAGLFGKDAFELAGEMFEVDGVGHGMTLSDRRNLPTPPGVGYPAPWL